MELQTRTADALRLPAPHTTGTFPVEAALAHRRSVRSYADAPLSLEEMGQLLWAAQGVTNSEGGRTAPSAGALYPLETYVVAGRVTGLSPGVYRYLPASHALASVAAGDRRKDLAGAAWGQDWVREAPAALVLVAVYERTARKYGARASRYVQIEAGCAAQNVALQAAALGLGSVVVGAFEDEEVTRAVGLGADERPLFVMPLGRP